MRAVMGMLGLLVVACGDDATTRDAAMDAPLDAPLDATSRDAEVNDAERNRDASDDAGEPFDAAADAPERTCVSRLGSLETTIALEHDVTDAPVLTASILTGDLEGDGRDGVLVSEPFQRRVLYLPCPTCPPRVFEEGLRQPVRARVIDVEGDGVRELLVADIGSVAPTTALSGRVVLLRPSESTYEYLSVDRGRIACAESGDLDGDGDLDLVVCEFGHEDGSLYWMEQTDSGWSEHELHRGSGAIHGYPVDVDGDGDLDVVSLTSQDTQTVFLHRNEGGGVFGSEVAWAAGDPDYGLSGMDAVDLDSDGDVDFLLANGDYFDSSDVDFEQFHAMHGVAWLENDGRGAFTHHTLYRGFGAYAVRGADVDGDCDVDVAIALLRVGSSIPEAERNADALVVLVNDGTQRFEARAVSGGARRLVSVGAYDWNEDGVADFLAGSFPLGPPGEGDARLVVTREGER